MKKIVKLSAAFMGMGIPAYFLARFQQGCIDRWKEQADRNQELYWVMDQWLNICQDGRRVSEYCHLWYGMFGTTFGQGAER